ncbi:MAG: hypothetical protein GXP24_01890 [Planctomycetes bacterium]|nr:hypothetical protein [Planctomycetota bacterium]
MRNFLAIALLAVVGALAAHSLQAEETIVGVPTVQAAVPSVRSQIVTIELIQAHQEYQLAKLRMHEYRFVTLPQQRRNLDDQIKFAEAEIAVLSRRLRDYRPFLRVGEYSPVRTAAQEHRLALVDVEQQLGRLKNERIGLLRLTRQHSQLYQLDVLRAATRLAMARRTVEVAVRQAGGGDAPAR